jgi:hypothetical protein
MKTHLSITEYSRLNDITRTATQKRIDTGKIDAVKFGKQWVITLDLTEDQRRKAMIMKGGRKK